MTVTALKGECDLEWAHADEVVGGSIYGDAAAAAAARMRLCGIFKAFAKQISYP